MNSLARDERGAGLGYLLGYAGLIPYIALAVTDALGIGASGQWPVERWFVAYSAIILAFLGGIRWGTFASRVDGAVRDLAIGVSISLAAFAAILPEPLGRSVLLLAVGHGLAALADWLLPSPHLRGWMKPLRMQLSAIVLLCHMVVLW